MSEGADEAAIDSDHPIIDPHLHHWDILPPREPQRFLLDEALATIAGSGHNVTHTVFVQCHAMYRADGPEELKPLGETEFVTGIAAMSASGNYGPVRLAHRIVGTADMLLGEAVGGVLEQHVAIAGERFRGIRSSTAYAEGGLFGFPCDPAFKHAMRDERFVAAARVLASMDLSLDVWCVHPQLDDVTALARAVPELTIVLDHLGTPADASEAARRDWGTKLRELAGFENVYVKLGGLGMDITRPLSAQIGGASSEELAAAWRPYIETCIEAFGAERAMFESNFPPDQSAGSYGATWNAFKRLAEGCSEQEKDRLFRGTAAEVYRIEL